MGKKRLRANPGAINRSLFSLCIFELEDRVLQAIDDHFRSCGVVVSSLQFDGLHAEHIEGDKQDPVSGEWKRLEEVMRGAEAAVESKLGYKISLMEKPLFQGRDAAAQVPGEAGGAGDVIYREEMGGSGDEGDGA